MSVAIALLSSAADLSVFATAMLVLNATQGVDFVLAISRTWAGGVRAGLAALPGINAGCVVHAVAAAFGLAALLAVCPAAFWRCSGPGRLAWRGWA